MKPQDTGGPGALGGAVMAWTVFTTTFLWTPTMRGFLKPEISTWVVMGLQGTGREGSFWVFPSLAVVALAAFYLEGRGRWRPLFHALLLGWHTTITGIMLYGAVMHGRGSVFEGGMWGIRVPLLALAVPLAAFLGLAVRWVLSERRRSGPPAVIPWSTVHWRTLALALLLLPVAAGLFQRGEGIGWTTRLATAATILQWILLTQALSYRPPNGHRAAGHLDGAGGHRPNGALSPAAGRPSDPGPPLVAPAPNSRGR